MASCKNDQCSCPSATPKKGKKLDTQLFPKCKGTKYDRDIVKKTRERREKKNKQNKKKKKSSFNLKQYRESNLFDVDETKIPDYYATEFKTQDDMAKISDIFNKILQSEIREDPRERYGSTNSPKSKTRNALLTRGSYETQEEWEENLLTNPFYELAQL